MSAVTVVDRETFVNARPVANATLRVTPEQFEKARVVEAAPLAPTRNSYVASTAKPVPASQRPAKSFTDRKVVAKLPPPIPPSGGHEPRIVDSAKPERPAEPNSRTQPSNAESNPNAHNNVAPLRHNSVTSRLRPPRGNANAQGEQPRQYDQHPAVKFAPPARASDDKYDVHPPLNNRIIRATEKGRAKEGTASKERKAQPPPKSK